jgi:hypothetical protein
MTDHFKDKKNVLFQKINNEWYLFAEIGDKNSLEFTKLPSGVNPMTDNLDIISITDDKKKKKKQRRDSQEINF